MVSSALLDLPSSPTLAFFSVYVYTFTYCIGENCNKCNYHNLVLR